MSELEDLVGEQDNAAASLRGKLLAAERQMIDVRRDSEKLATTFREEMNELRRAWTDETDTLKGEIADLEEQLRQREDEVTKRGRRLLRALIFALDKSSSN